MILNKEQRLDKKKYNIALGWIKMKVVREQENTIFDSSTKLSHSLEEIIKVKKNLFRRL